MLAEAARRCKLLAAKHGGRGAGYKWTDTDITWAAGPDVTTTLYHRTGGTNPHPHPHPHPHPNPHPNPHQVAPEDDGDYEFVPAMGDMGDMS